MDIREVVEQGMSLYPVDRDLRGLERKLDAAEKSGKATKPIANQITNRLAILQNGGKRSTDSPECQT